MGHSYVLSSAESDAIFQQPGLLDAARGIALGRAWLGASTTAVSMSGAGDWWRGGVGFGIQALTSNGRSEQSASLAYARTTFGLRVGAAARVVDQLEGGNRDTYGVGDIGVARAIGFVTTGVAVQNLGPDPNLAGGRGRLPTAVTLGASTRSRPTGPLDLIFAVRSSWVRDRKFAYGGGIEAGYYPVTGRTFYVRAGASESEEQLGLLTLGGGFTGDRISIDYAFQAADSDAESAAHRVTLRWR